MTDRPHDGASQEAGRAAEFIGPPPPPLSELRRRIRENRRSVAARPARVEEPAPPTRAEIEKRLEEYRAEMARTGLGLLEPRATAWLAVVPFWTEELALACGFPAKGGVARFVDDATRIGLCESTLSAGLATGNARAFWMPEAIRAAVLTELNRRDLSAARQAAADAGRALGPRGNLPAGLMEWAALASQLIQSDRVAAEHLKAEVIGCLEKGLLASAQVWVRQGEALGRAVSRDVLLAARLAERRVELVNRRALDERFLERFLPRQEQIAEAVELLRDERRWALHYLGMGGVGKTILLRYIGSRLAREHGFLACRVDFDHLSPDYPVRRPGQLLIELAEELRLYAETRRHLDKFQEVENWGRDLHESVSNVTAEPLVTQRSPLFGSFLRAFADLLRLLEKPVVMILDTCEELANAQSGLSYGLNVSAAFSVLEDVHRLVPTVRVIFAGRRLLARAGLDEHGQGWRATGPDVPPDLPENKPYLRLHLIRGFTASEAAQLFSAGDTPLSAELQEVIRAESPDVGPPTGIEFVPPRPLDAGQRYNPFNLALYIDWARSQPDLSPEEIASKEIDPYVEMRILRRIQNRAAFKLMPAAVLLGRFDADMLRPAFPGLDSEFKQAFEVLSYQEWIETQFDAALNVKFLAIRDQFLTRLRAFYDRKDNRPAREEAWSRLVLGLEAAVRDRDPGDLSISHVDAALRLSPDAGDLWQHLERRIAEQGRWDWALNVTNRLLAEGNAIAGWDHPLRAAVTATLAAALTHERPKDASRVGVWARVMEAADRVPGESADHYRFRALAGTIASYCAVGQMPPSDLFQRLAELAGRTDLSQTWAHAALLAMLDDLLERAIARPDGRADLLADLKRFPVLIPNALGASTPLWMLLFNRMLVGRLSILSDRWPATAGVMLLHAVKETLPADPIGQRLADWRVPASPVDRIRLEAARLHYLGTFRPVLGPQKDNLAAAVERERAAWMLEATGRLHLIDAERLVSFLLLYALARGPVQPRELKALQEAEKYDLSRQPVSDAHRATPPLFVSIAYAWLALGRSDQALELLARRMEEAVATRQDRETVRAADLARLHIARRMRLAPIAREAAGRLGSGSEAPDVNAVWPLLAVTGDPITPSGDAPDVGPPRETHSYLSRHFALTPPAVRDAVVHIVRTAPPAIEAALAAHDEIAAHALALDRMEGRLLSGHTVGTSFDAEGLLERNPTHAEDVFRLLARWSALSDRPLPDSDVKPLKGHPRVPPASLDPVLDANDAPGPLGGISHWSGSHAIPEGTDPPTGVWVRRVGLRRMGEIALEEAELLALRLPTRAIHLLDVACDYFNRAGDPVGAVQAGTRGAIAAVHAGVRTKASDLLDDGVRPAYKHLRSGGCVADLPSWGELDSWAKEISPSALELLDHPEWGPWLHRIVACLVWVDRQRDRSAANAAKLRSRFEPVELDRTPGSDLPPPPDRDWIYSLIGCGGLIAFLAIVIGVRHWLGYEPVPRPKPEDVPAWMWAVFGSAAVLALAIAWLAQSGWLRSLLGSAMLLRFEVTPGTGEAAGADPSGPTVRFRFRRRFVQARLRWPLLTWDRILDTEVVAGPFGLDAVKAAERVPSQIRYPLNVLHERQKYHSLPLPLDVGPGLAGLPWEALLTPPAQLRSKRGPGWPLQFYRRGDPLHGEHVGLPRMDHVVFVGRPWDSFVKRWWVKPAEPVDHYGMPTTEGGPTRPTGPSWLKVMSPAGLEAEALESAALLLVGKPASTSAGLQLVISDERSVVGEGASFVLIAASVAASRRAGLVIVQGEPVEAESRLDSDREQVQYLRGYAAQVFANGARAVLLIPPLAPPIADLVLLSLMQRLWMLSPVPAPDLHHLLDAVSAARQCIPDRELALDLTLFARPPAMPMMEAPLPPWEAILTARPWPWRGAVPTPSDPS